jgi:hypothetical protein
MSSLIKTFKNNKEFHNPPLFPLLKNPLLKKVEQNNPLLKKVEQNIEQNIEQNVTKNNQNNPQSFAPLFLKVDKVEYILYCIIILNVWNFVV